MMNMQLRASKSGIQYAYQKSVCGEYPYSIFVTVVLLVCSGAAAEDFVPFVIPARPNSKSPIAITSFKPIETDSERLVVRSGHFYRDGRRVCLWGVNLSFGANLPRREDAPYVAARLAAAGVNAVRCHHMDSARWPRGLWNAKDGKTIAPEALERLDYFIDQLARHGICVNINLHVGRVHSQFLGLPKTNRQYDKISNIFTPALLDAQKQYARELLTHVNRYRKVRYADDPAVAIVEITNENSFFMWGSEKTLRTLPPYYADILQSKFNTWLRKHYGSTDKLRKAWAEGAEPFGKNLLVNGNFRTMAAGRSAPENWHLEQHSGCRASLSRRRYQSRDAVRIEIDKTTGTDWHLQLNQGGFPVKAVQYYTVIFQAASDEPRQINCSLGQAHSPWNNLGLSQRVELTSNWQTFRYSFIARADDNNARISFSFGGGSKVPVYLTNVEFRPGGRVGLDKNESIEAGSIALFADSETPARTLDRMRFLAETEKAYFDGMRNFIKKDLGCKALVTGTIVFGPLGLYAQSDMDFIDAHAYWQHPRFPGRPWDRGNWIVEQKAMTDYPTQATLFRLAASRLAGKPFTVSEYNHPAPLDSQAECVPMIASFAAAQDWDGVWLYTYSHSSDDWDRQTLNSYFDIDTNPAKWGFMRAGTAIFRHAGIAPLDSVNTVRLVESADMVIDLAKLHVKHDRNMLNVLAEQPKTTYQDFLKKQIIVNLSEISVVANAGWSPSVLTWSVNEQSHGFYRAASREADVYVGHAEKFKEETHSDIVIRRPSFVALSITTLDGAIFSESEKILITACGRCENTGMKFSKDRRTVGRNWGGPPVQIQPVEGTLALPKGRWICHALGPDGLPSSEVPISYQDGQGVLKLSPQYKTMWYLLRRRKPKNRNSAEGTSAFGGLVLFDFDKGFDVNTVVTNDAKVALSESGALRIETSHEEQWPGITLKAPSGKWDLSKYEYISVDAKNIAAEPVTVYCRVDNPGADGIKNCVTGSLKLNPKTSETLTVRVFPTPWRLSEPMELIGMRGAPVHSGKIDPANVTQLLVFVSKPRRDHVFEIDNMRAGGHVQVLDAKAFFPFIDEFGQYIHKDWPGKTHSRNELIAHGKAEKKDLAAHPAPTDRNQYGGWTAGPKLKATGFFRVQKYQGKWWMMDPDGRLFWSHGIDCVRSRNDTPITDREHYYRDLPTNNSPFAKFYGRGGWAPHGYYKDHSPYRTYDFSRANFLRKYGPNWEQAFANITHRRLKSWGINTIANWSQDSIYLMRKTPYVGTISYTARKLEGSKGYWGKFYDVFDPTFRSALRRRLAREEDASIGDPWCIGFFVHNELSWGDETSLAVATLISPADQPAKKVFVEDLKTKYKTIGKLNAAWGTGYETWQALLQSKHPPDKTKAWADLTAFYTRTAETYFRTIHEELKKVAPNQLYMGCRFAWVNDRAARAATKFCDIVSYNRYSYSVENHRLPNGIDKPTIIGEFHFGALDRGMFHTGLKKTANQQDRADKYKSYVRGALRNPYIVGTHWFQYKDQATTGRGDGENYQIGFIDICDTPYPETVQTCREVGYTLYEYRLNAR